MHSGRPSRTSVGLPKGWPPSPTEPRYLAAYELDGPEVVQSAAWKAAGEAGRWPAGVRPHTMNRHLALYEWVGGSAALTGKTPVSGPHSEWYDALQLSHNVS